MIIKTSDFITSATSKSQYPPPVLPEIAFVGRSNVGKSSLINSITGRKSLAKVSGTPGRTRLVNFFLLNNAVYLVDLPGYGYAKVSKKEMENFAIIIEEYLNYRENLKKIILLVDARHKPTEDDRTMYGYIKASGIPCLIVGTKLDKLKRNEIKKNMALIKETLQLRAEDEIIFFSSLNLENKEEMLNMALKDLGIEETDTITKDELIKGKEEAKLKEIKDKELELQRQRSREGQIKSMEKNNNPKEEKVKVDPKERLRAIIEAKKRGSNAPLPRKGRGQGVEDSSTVFGSKGKNKPTKGKSHTAK